MEFYSNFTNSLTSSLRWSTRKFSPKLDLTAQTGKHLKIKLGKSNNNNNPAFIKEKKAFQWRLMLSGDAAVSKTSGSWKLRFWFIQFLPCWLGICSWALTLVHIWPPHEYALCAPSMRREETHKRNGCLMGLAITCVGTSHWASRRTWGAEKRRVGTVSFCHMLFLPSGKTLRKGCWFLYPQLPPSLSLPVLHVFPYPFYFPRVPTLCSLSR